MQYSDAQTPEPHPKSSSEEFDLGFTPLDDKILRRKDLELIDKVILSVLARFQGEKSHVSTSVKSLATLCNLGRERTYASLKRLANAGDLLIVSRGKFGKANLYSVRYRSNRTLRKRLAEKSTLKRRAKIHVLPSPKPREI